MNIDTLREGSFIIDMIDPKEGKVVWRSTGQQKKESYKRQPSKDVIDQIIKKICSRISQKNSGVSKAQQRLLILRIKLLLNPKAGSAKIQVFFRHLPVTFAAS